MSSSIYGENEAIQVPVQFKGKSVGVMCIPVTPPRQTLSVLIVFMVNQAGMIREHDLSVNINSEDALPCSHRRINTLLWAETSSSKTLFDSQNLVPRW